MALSSSRRVGAVAIGVVAAAGGVARGAGTVTVRVATYNVAADINGVTAVNDSAISTVLGGIGNANPDGTVHPLDILALEETTSNAATVQPIANDLNTLYKTTSYTVPSLQPGEVGGDATDGNGPNSIIYNAATLQLVSAVAVGTPTGSTNGVYRQIARYEFEPAASLGGTAAGAFYVYVDHYKSGSTSSDLTARGQEAAAVRADAATLPVNSRVLYVGDYNIGASTEQSITNIGAAGVGQAFDPINTPGNYALNPAFQGVLTESATDLRYRDDLQLVTGNVMADNTGLQYVAGSYTAFGNDGTTPVYGSVAAASNTALPGLSNRSAVLSALTTVTDHLPVVADYADVVGPTVARWALTTGGTWGTVGDWTTTVVPNGAGAAVTFGPLAAAGTVTLDGSRTVGRVTFNSAAAYTLAAGTGGTLTIDDTGDPAGVAPAITVAAGSHTIAVPVTLANGVAVTTASGATLTIGGAVGGAGTLAVTAGSTVDVTAGTVGVPVSVAGSVVFAGTGAVGGLAVAGGGRVTVAATSAGRTLLVTPTLAVAGQVDLTDNDLDVTGGNLAAVTALAASGYAGGSWAGPGLASSAAAADSSHTAAVGVIANVAADGTSPLYTSFDGRAVAATDVLVRYTRYGDANLDGVVDAADYTRVDAGFVDRLTGWANGDFNYDGTVDGTDYALMDNSFNQQGTAAAAAVVVAVPEPAGMAVVLGAAVGTWRRRKVIRAAGLPASAGSSTGRRGDATAG